MFRHVPLQTLLPDCRGPGDALTGYNCGNYLIYGKDDLDGQIGKCVFDAEGKSVCECPPLPYYLRCCPARGAVLCVPPSSMCPPPFLSQREQTGCWIHLPIDTTSVEWQHNVAIHTHYLNSCILI